VTVLDGYPATGFDVTRLLRDTADQPGLLVLLSVNSSGRVRDLLIQGLEALPPGAARSLHVLVAKQEITAHRNDAGDVPVHTWHPRPDSAPLVRYDAESADACELCHNTDTAVLIPITPRSFDGSLPATLTRITPSIADAGRNRELWQLCNADVESIALESDSPEDIKWRPPGRMSIVVDHKQLLRSPDFRKAAAASLSDQLRRNRCKPKPADLVLMPRHEYAYPYRSALIKSMSAILGRNPTVMAFPPNKEWPENLKETVRKAKECIAVVTLGAVTGTTLHGALAAIQNSREPAPYDLYAYVLHARLAQRRAWETLENSYYNAIFAAWHSYLPERSPLADEERTLQGLSNSAIDTLSDEARSFLSARREFLSGGEERGVFWGTDPSDEVSPNSIYGESLTGRAVYVAVCSAMERARNEDLKSRAAPVRRVFEMPAIVRSYYDPMILAAVLRWLRPHEAWWGNELVDESKSVSWMLNRATAKQKAILVPELLLAAAQGKLNRPGVLSVQATAKMLLNSSDLTTAQKAPIELGRALVPDYGTADDQQKENRSAVTRIEDVSATSELVSLLPGMLQDLQQGKLSEKTRKALEDKAEELAQNNGDKEQPTP
jgi:hypothetical protein